MLTAILAAGAAAAAPKGDNPYGLVPALREGGLISQTVFGILVLMLFVSLYILFTKLFEQQKVINQYKRVRAGFWNNNSLREASAKLEKNSAYKQIVDDGLSAQEQHTRLTDPVEAHDWLHGSLARSEATINSQLNAWPGLPRDRRRYRTVHRSVRYGYRHLPRAHQDRRCRSGIDRRRRRPGR